MADVDGVTPDHKVLVLRDQHITTEEHMPWRSIPSRPGAGNTPRLSELILRGVVDTCFADAAAAYEKWTICLPFTISHKRSVCFSVPKNGQRNKRSSPRSTHPETGQRSSCLIYRIHHGRDSRRRGFRFGRPHSRRRYGMMNKLMSESKTR